MVFRTLISWLASAVRPRGRRQGFVYVADVEAGPMREAKPGATVRNPDRGPPWIVVDHSLRSVIPAKWPGRLWRVEILEEAPEQPNATARYTRAAAVRVLEEAPASALFGPRGEAVVRVIDRAGRLELDDVRALSELVGDEARAAYSRAWNRWLAEVDQASPHFGENHDGTLAVFAGETRSPIGGGFTVLHEVVSRRARALAGDAAFETDEDGEVFLAADWAGASHALLHAAMALGAPDLVPPGDRELLTRAWTARFAE